MANQLPEMTDFPIVGGYGADTVLKISSERSINFYPAIHPLGKKPLALHPTQGYSFATNIGMNGGPVRGLYTFNNKIYACTKDALFEIDTSLVVTSLGVLTFSTNTGFVRIISNQTQVVFVDGVSGLLWDTTSNTLSTITFPAGVVVADITYMDGYFIAAAADFNSAPSNRFYVSNLDDGSTWQALQFAQINTAADYMVGCSRLKRRLFLFGHISTEVWLDAGDATFPFRRDNNLLFEHGLESVGSLVQGFDRLFYLSRNENGVDSVKMVEGTVPVDISTYEINKLIQTLNNTESAVGTVKKIDGIIFYKLTIDNTTLVYNVTMSTPENRLWHEELVWELVDNYAQYIRHTENAHVFFNSVHYIGDYRSSKLFQYSKDFNTNDGVSIRRQRITKVFSDPNYHRLFIHKLQVDLLQGVGVPGTLDNSFPMQILFKDEDPLINLTISIDGGIFYEPRGISFIGEAGQRTYRTIWEKLGNERQYIFSFVTFNSVPIYILGASISYEVGYE